MINKNKQLKMVAAMKDYVKRFITGKSMDLDESGTRLMINYFLTEVLGYTAIEEVKTEYMIRGTYADYVIQTKGTRHFLVEVKALSLALSDKHLRQTINYGANEGIEWALLTNGRCFELYRILFEKPIDSKRIFSIDLTDPIQVKNCVPLLESLHRDSVMNKGLEVLWNKTVALTPESIAGILYAPQVTNFIKRTLKEKFKSSFSDEDIESAVNTIITTSIPIENVKIMKVKKNVAKKKETSDQTAIVKDVDVTVSLVNETDDQMNSGF